MIDCIASYHLNPWTCGIAKFNQILATHLGLPVVGITNLPAESPRRPLLSLKLSEFEPQHVHFLDEWARERAGQLRQPGLVPHRQQRAADPDRLDAGCVAGVQRPPFALRRDAIPER